mmetsp:Transcript_15703/g.34119  ORF Transcript_15703/g.34119 Transcript_15703/m.34119 type:complete len:202 (+) Transcript_15703:130-735(+)|eukprot:CAMPEP_0206612380 /NCGR_PEP_ID=MMETSP0325_2-20121206/55940_1 /ASSEMBLY_ACC=CAM_ASM_000347 /TAXON_ID=2866 /ORGANISM="Crypthecodinium cohnii, Strain Seligo" /LENGTH=201 /DNA_ID=CAMNT_0054132031 /DNA_START=121 /DNA_END=726 /DNA_ORIENTATION=-
MGCILSFFFGSDDPPPRDYYCRHREPYHQSRDEARLPAFTRRLRVYHGTSVAAAQSIRGSGHFLPSRRGIYGATTYFSKNLNKAKEFGPMILECEVDEYAVRQIEERGGIVCCDDFRSANGKIIQAFQERSICGPFNRCDYIECRECKTASQRRDEHAARRQDWEQNKKACPGVRGASCRGSGWCRRESKFCKDCHKALYG